MNQESPLADQILEAVAKIPTCRIEELASLFPDLTGRALREAVASLI